MTFLTPNCLDQAHEGVGKVFLNIPAYFDLPKVRQYIRHAVDAAQRAKVQLLVVNASVFVPDPITDLAAIEITRELSTYVRQSYRAAYLIFGEPSDPRCVEYWRILYHQTSLSPGSARTMLPNKAILSLQEALCMPQALKRSPGISYRNA